MTTTAWSPLSTEGLGCRPVGGVGRAEGRRRDDTEVAALAQRAAVGQAQGRRGAGGRVGGQQSDQGQAGRGAEAGQLCSGVGDSGPARVRLTSLPSPGHSTGWVLAGPSRPRMTSRAAPALLVHTRPAGGCGAGSRWRGTGPPSRRRRWPARWPMRRSRCRRWHRRRRRRRCRRGWRGSRCGRWRRRRSSAGPVCRAGRSSGGPGRPTTPAPPRRGRRGPSSGTSSRCRSTSWQGRGRSWRRPRERRQRRCRRRRPRRQRP